MHDVKIIPPNISPETMKSMWQFFLKTSVPRLIEKKRMEVAEKRGETNVHQSKGLEQTIY